MADEALLDPAVAARLALARTGTEGFVRLRIADLGVGHVGVLDVQVRTTGAPRTYARKRGGEGMLTRVTLADATGEIDLVLWDDEARLCTTGPLRTGAFVRLHGPTVKAGYRGGIELALGSAEIVPLPTVSPASAVIEGILLSVGDARAIGALPATRFTCDLVLDTAPGEVRVAVWDGLVKQARAAGVGRRVRVVGAVANVLLTGWWTADPATGALLELPGDPASVSATHK